MQLNSIKIRYIVNRGLRQSMQAMSFLRITCQVKSVVRPKTCVHRCTYQYSCKYWTWTVRGPILKCFQNRLKKRPWIIKIRKTVFHDFCSWFFLNRRYFKYHIACAGGLWLQHHGYFTCLPMLLKAHLVSAPPCPYTHTHNFFHW